MNELVELAFKLGVSGAKVISTGEISVEDDLAGLCHEPRCENYGLSANCPPHVSGPSGFRELLKNFNQAIVFKLDVPAESLLSHRRRKIFQNLQEIAAALDKAAVNQGKGANAFCGGSCKQLFCNNYRKCNVLDGRECRNTDKARPSMSGFGINVSKLMESAGWEIEWYKGDNTPLTGTVCGLVLID